jgi:ABC-type multidrug transport system fused ATPase/permease subunit
MTLTLLGTLASLSQIPDTVQKGLLALVSLKRLCAFLNSDTLENYTTQCGSLISFDHASVTWPSRNIEAGEDQSLHLFSLSDINITFPESASFVLVCGATGSGKVNNPD